MPRKATTTGVTAGKPKPTPVVYQLKITLKSSKPPIWRRVEVPNCTLEQLHAIIQTVMPWDSSHMWDFAITREERYGPGGEFGMDDTEPAADVSLHQLVARGVKKFVYTYDFGDSWEHDIVIEKTVASEAGVKYPRCTDGKLAGPPEDCGGIHGYYDLVEALADPDHENHEEVIENHEGIDPDVFDRDAVNTLLARIFR